MDLKDIKETEAWILYSRGADFARLKGMYSDTDTNFRMYNDDQWNGAILDGIEPVQLNFIKPIVNYKVGNITQNLYAVNYSSENNNESFKEMANRTCKMLNRKMSKVWEKDYMDYKIKQMVKNSAINSQVPAYMTYDEETKIPLTEILSKNDIYFGNENDSEIQSQPYMIIKRRIPVSSAKLLAEEEEVSEEEIDYIIGDQETLEESGKDSKIEKDNNVTIIYKFWKEKKTVHYSISTRYVEIKTDEDMQLKYYPLFHMLWEDKEGSARGAGEITRGLIANQIEVNKTLMRRAVVTKNTAYPTKIVNVEKVTNPEAVNRVGAVLEVADKTTDDVHKAFGIIQPAQMSDDVEKLQKDLIDMSRNLANASQAAAGDVNAEEASGRAILAVQQASRTPLTDQLSNLKKAAEDYARIAFDMIRVYNDEGMDLEEEVEDLTTGETTIQVVNIPPETLNEIEVNIKVDITPKSPYDRYAQERSIENLFTKGMFNPQMLQQLKFYLECLEDDSVMPKQKLLDRVNKELEKQKRIAEKNAEAQKMIQEQNGFLNSDPNAQATQIMKNKLKQEITQAYNAKKGQSEKVAQQLEKNENK